MTCVPMPFCGTETLKLSVCISLPMVLKQSVYPNSIKKIYSVRSIYILIYVIIFSVVKKKKNNKIKTLTPTVDTMCAQYAVY